MFLIVAQIVKPYICGNILFLVASAALIMCNAQNHWLRRNIIILNRLEIKSRLSPKLDVKTFFSEQ